MSDVRKNMPGRLLRLLSLLQSRREWPGAELAERLGVSARTLRRDVDRLRALDYPVHGTTGTAGGYRLASGRALPPLLLDDEEAVAVALGLITAGGVTGIEESAMRALAKLERVLPARLRPRLAAFAGAAVAAPGRRAPSADPMVLAVLASACRDHEVMRFDHRRQGAASARRVEPHHLVTVADRWYLIAFDLDRTGWRTFRVDRIADPLPTHARFDPRPLPAPDPATYLIRSLNSAVYRHNAVLRVGVAADTLRDKLFAAVFGPIVADGPDACTIRLSADSAELITQYVAAIIALDAPVTLMEATEEIVIRLRELRNRLPA
ncbi:MULTISPECIES: YafY family protein [unclassified Nocardia]|uniref:helix-turn-helix transcriptional regulator n=1 Tax=unclassified Nocardia TaxID=2637762 RepID=UPI001CE41AE5|nr:MULTISPECIES: WYL domain-containing protein [unclassified Nocardia]